MRILDRLVLGSFLKLFLVSILATPPLFVVGELTEDLDTFVDQGMTTTQVLHGYLYRVPEYIVWSFPIAALIAAVFTIYNMTAHRELVAAKAGGVSFHRIFLPILLAGLVLTGVALALTEVAPRANSVAFDIHQNEDRRQDWRTDFVYQTEGGLALAARRLSVPDGSLQGVVLQRPPESHRAGLHMEASAARWDSAGGWTFENGYMRVMEDERGAITSYEFESLRFPALTEKPAELLETPPEDEEMTYGEIGRLADIIQRSGGTPHKLLVRKEQKLAIPVATLVIILFGAPLATSTKRGGTAYGIGIALGTTLLYLLLLKVAGGFGSSGAIPPLVAGWLPNALFFTAGAVLMARVRT